MQELLEQLQVNINDGGDVERENLGNQQATNYRETQGTACFGPGAKPQRDWQGTQQRCHRGHHDGTEAKQAALIDSVCGAFPLVPLRFQRKIDHHDGVFLDDTDQHDDPHKSVNVQFHVEKQQRE